MRQYPSAAAFPPSLLSSLRRVPADCLAAARLPLRLLPALRSDSCLVPAAVFCFPASHEVLLVVPPLVPTARHDLLRGADASRSSRWLAMNFVAKRLHASPACFVFHGCPGDPFPGCVSLVLPCSPPPCPSLPPPPPLPLALSAPLLRSAPFCLASSRGSGTEWNQLASHLPPRGRPPWLPQVVGRLAELPGFS